MFQPLWQSSHMLHLANHQHHFCDLAFTGIGTDAMGLLAGEVMPGRAGESLLLDAQQGAVAEDKTFCQVCEDAREAGHDRS